MKDWVTLVNSRLPEGQLETCVASELFALSCRKGGGCNQQGYAAGCHQLCCTLGLAGMRGNTSQRQLAPTAEQ